MTVDGATQPDVKVVLDLEGFIRQATLANRLAAETLDHWLGRHWAQTVEKCDRAQLADLVAVALAQGVSPYCCLTQRFPSGQAIPIEYMAVRLKGGDMLAIGRDRRALEDLLPGTAAMQQSNAPANDRSREACGLGHAATGNYLSGQGPLAQLLGSMTEQLGTTTLKGLVSATVGLVEKHYIEAALAEVQGNRSAAAKMLGVSRQSLYVKMARYGIGDNEASDLTQLVRPVS